MKRALAFLTFLTFIVPLATAEPLPEDSLSKAPSPPSTSLLPPLPAEEGKSGLERRQEREQKWRAEGLSLIPHRLSYFFPVTYNVTPNENQPDVEDNHVEAKFQFSAKVLLLNNILKYDAHLYFGYTQLSMWQVYDRENSAAFRDNNYEPEVFITFDQPYSLGSFKARGVDVGFVHQSNGQTKPLSRSWNRFFLRATLERNHIVLGFRPWFRIPEDDGHDDNPDIHRYLGYGELTLAFLYKNHLLSVMTRNNLSVNDNKGAVQVDYTFPMTRNLNGLCQFFTGYAESLLDYNHSNTRVSVGIALSPWN